MISKLRMSFGESLKHHRSRRKISVGDMATRMETNRAQIWRLENDQTNPRLDTILKLCGILEISIADLVQLENFDGHDEDQFINFYKSRGAEEKDKIRQISQIL